MKLINNKIIDLEIGSAFRGNHPRSKYLGSVMDLKEDFFLYFKIKLPNEHSEIISMDYTDWGFEQENGLISVINDKSLIRFIEKSKKTYLDYISSQNKIIELINKGK